MLKQMFITLFCSAILLGCNVPKESTLSDGYQFGDGLREVLRLQDKWCNKSDPVSKLILLKVLEKRGFVFDGETVCTIDLIEVLGAM